MYNMCIMSRYSGGGKKIALQKRVKRRLFYYGVNCAALLLAGNTIAGLWLVGAMEEAPGSERSWSMAMGFKRELTVCIDIYKTLREEGCKRVGREIHEAKIEIRRSKSPIEITQSTHTPLGVNIR